MPRKDDDDDDEYLVDDYDDHRRGAIKAHRGTLIMVFGIIGLVMCSGFGIAAYLMGKNDLREIRAGRMDAEGESMTNVGYVLGIVSSIIFCIQLFAVVAYIAVIAIILGTR